MRSVVFAVLLAVSLSFPCLAQRDTNISTRASLTVYVAFTNERALGKSIEVRVYQRGQILFGESFTDERGRAKFDQVPAGYYHVEVQGTGIEKTEGPEFEILDMEGAHTETVRAKPTADATAGGPSSPAGTGATISATELKIPEKAQKEFDKGVDAFTAGDNKKAEESFNKAIEEYPKYANAYSNLGVLYIKLGDQAKAKEAFNKAVTVDSKFAPGYVNLARLSFAAHSYPETENTVNKALAISPDNLDALALLATAEYMNKENDKALANVRHIHSLPGHEPFSGVHLLAAQILMEENERDQAIDQYIAFLQESPNDLRVPAVRKTLAQMKNTQH
jgi:tetratricopeptide (TPR) repeat protein